MIDLGNSRRLRSRSRLGQSEPLNTEKLLLVEGSTDEKFFNSFNENLTIADVVVESYEGKSNLNTKYLEALIGRTGFNAVESLGIIRDADNFAENAFRSVQTSIADSGLPVPPSLTNRRAVANEGDAWRPLTISVFILPDNENPGELETLLYRTLDSDIAKCIDNFMKCAEETATGESPSKPDKARVAAYIAVQKKAPHSPAVSARQGVWDFDHNVLSSVRRFLREL